ncbi:glycosyltransferase family 2 protein [Arcticibacter sp. MXS-1]|uniref:glycosyltransferase family 2 protein n=1 Tax=Arcticibacter sp. MXS-1 TaxID=3341726 RepID=UPI0035A82C1F
MKSKKTGGEREHYYPNDGVNPVISIIIVTLNPTPFDLEKCLDSIVRQSYQNLEILIFDGGSRDDTLNIFQKCERYISYWQSEPDSGVYHAMNKAASKAGGDWLYFLGADDKLLPGFSDMALRLSSSNTIYYGDMSYDGKPTSRKRYTTYRLAKETICHQAIFYPRSVFKKYQYDLAYPVAADWALNLHLWSDRFYKFKFYPLLIADFSMSGISGRTKDHNFLRDQPLLIKKTLGLFAYYRFRLKQYKRLIKN